LFKPQHGPPSRVERRRRMVLDGLLAYIQQHCTHGYGAPAASRPDGHGTFTASSCSTRPSFHLRPSARFALGALEAFRS
jgi:hypothetical protein